MPVPTRVNTGQTGNCVNVLLACGAAVVGRRPVSGPLLERAPWVLRSNSREHCQRTYAELGMALLRALTL
jgi:hypothetical protein